MLKHALLVFLLFSALSTPIRADENTPWSLETTRACKYRLAWHDRGSGGDNDLSVYTPVVPAGFYMISGYAQGDYDAPRQCVTAVRPSPTNPDTGAPLLVSPSRWQLIWMDKGTGANMDGSIWQAVPPHDDYACIGHVGQTGYQPPKISSYRCLHKCLLQGTPVPEALWTDRGTGANKPVSVYRLQNSKGFIARPDRSAPPGLADIGTTASCVRMESVISTPAPQKDSKQWAEPDESRKPSAQQKRREWVDPDKVQKQPRKNNEWKNPDELY
ncbi:MAG: Vps62-related protein [Gammaproteobacteria bacterium]|nr:Vps62-related protein [Gammaproteobacteria bacterium]